MISPTKAPKVRVVLLALAACAVVCTAGVASSNNDDSRGPVRDSRDARSGFGRPETLTGIISAVDERGVLTLTRVGSTEPPTTQLLVARQRPADGSQNDSQGPETVQATPGPGQTDYSFRITPSTLIRVNGQRTSLGQLAGLQNKQATVHFIPKRNGNFALGIEIGN